ncbi:MULTISPECIES: glycosyltransferase family 2 protein [Aeromonas]|uniref:glycosyltransferase family 2 protein n=1 Tax=Aeromonas TaxID=642 RepID=UPI00259D5A05|nr:glycosyltransferase family 2 protein [Aeromonas salmonicida]MDM5113265.1 glycosyltransferase family 2 protein [Aeromonas salmonicida]
MKLCIATMMKNEADALIEWVCYHLAIGVDSFIVANNESSDATEEILILLSEFCDLTYFNFETPKNSRPQLPAFNYMLNKYKQDHDLMAFIDADEFFCPMDGHERINKEITKIFSNQDIGALAINWCNYGSSGATFKEDGLVIERFTQHSLHTFPANHHYKTIFRARDVSRFINPHHVETSKKYIHCDGSDLITHPQIGVGLSKEVKWNTIRINHYVIKSLQEYFVGKALRGNASTQRPVDRKSYFLSYDRNEITENFTSAIVRSTYSKIAELITFAKNKFGVTPTYLQQLEEYLNANSFYHIDLFDDQNISCWAVNKAGSNYELIIEQTDNEKRLPPNINRPDVLKAILGNTYNEQLRCGFSYKIDKSDVKKIIITNGILEHIIFSA